MKSSERSPSLPAYHKRAGLVFGSVIGDRNATMRSSRVVSLISMDFMVYSSRRLASSNTRFIRRSGMIHGAIATTISGQEA